LNSKQVELENTSAVRGEGASPMRTFCGQEGGFLQMRMPALFSAKNFRFFEIYGGPTDEGGGCIELVRIFCG